MNARIYKPAASAMQSGPTADEWVLEYTPARRKPVDPLMGWTGSADTRAQVTLKFPTKEEAIAYAAQHGVAAQVSEPSERKLNVRPMGYAGNFASSRRTPWSH
ncbi:MAG: ETC complex I subunit [Neomegalonema sp.]|nr:ETC complex I subunit [Neomegalonema sp.]